MGDYRNEYQKLRCKRNLLNDKTRATQARLEELQLETRENRAAMGDYERNFVVQAVADGDSYNTMCENAASEGIRWDWVDAYDYYNELSNGEERDEDEPQEWVRSTARQRVIDRAAAESARRFTYINENGDSELGMMPRTQDYTAWLEVYGPGGSGTDAMGAFEHAVIERIIRTAYPQQAYTPLSMREDNVPEPEWDTEDR